MPARLPRGVERKEGFTISIEESWKRRFMLACFNFSTLTKSNIAASNLVRDFIIKKTKYLEQEVKKKENGNAD